MVNLRHVLVDVLRDETRWGKFASKIKKSTSLPGEDHVTRGEGSIPGVM